MCGLAHLILYCLILYCLSNRFSNNFSSGEILNNQKAMEYNAQSGMLQCNFNYMQLRRIKRNTDRKATEIVMEEKFTLLFRSKFSIAGGELDIPVMVSDKWRTSIISSGFV